MDSEIVSVVTSHKRLAGTAALLRFDETDLNVKRFKGNVPMKADKVTPHKTQQTQSPQHQHAHIQKRFKEKLLENHSNLGLSPITELAKNMLDASLNTPKTSINGDSRSAAGRRFRQFRALNCQYEIADKDDGNDVTNSIIEATSLTSKATGGERVEMDISKMRTFNSLSSTFSNDSNSLDDDYMDAFDMATTTEQRSDQEPPPAVLQLPSNLDTLISGRLNEAAVEPNENNEHLPESNSSTASSSTTTSSNGGSDGGSVKKKFEMHRPKVRRCLSLYLDAQSSPDTNKSFTDFKRPKNAAATTEGTSPGGDGGGGGDGSGCGGGDGSGCGGGGGGTPVTTQKSAPSLSQSSSPKSSHGGSGDVGGVVVKHQMLRKSMSMNDAQIMTALALSEQNGEPDLIGDFSKPYALPLLHTGQRHSDLKTISSETLARLMSGEFLKTINSFHIVDCRYPYEYDGGHICGASNLYTHDQILETFPILQSHEDSPTKSGVSVIPAFAERNIIIFHCEFSSERGPKMMRFLRSNDRSLHTNVYPALDYPELYLLHNGYKDFSEKYADLCKPAGAYVPMLSPLHNEEFRYYRAKSKSWQCDSGLGGSTQIPKKKSLSRFTLNVAN